MRAQVLLAASLSIGLAAELRARQTGSENVCDTVILEYESELNELPSPPSDSAWMSFVLEQTHAMIEDSCVIPAVTGDASMVSSYSAFVSEITSWLDAYPDEINSFLSACHDDSMYGPVITSLGFPIEADRLCSELSFQTLASNSADTTEDATTSSELASATSSEEPATTDSSDDAEETGDDAAASESESESPDAAPRQTGMAVAAVAAAGFAVVNML